MSKRVKLLAIEADEADRRALERMIDEYRLPCACVMVQSLAEARAALAQGSSSAAISPTEPGLNSSKRLMCRCYSSAIAAMKPSRPKR